MRQETNNMADDIPLLLEDAESERQGMTSRR